MPYEEFGGRDDPNAPQRLMDDAEEVMEDTENLEEEEQENSSWYKFTQKITAYPTNYIILFVILAVTIPIACQALRMKQSSSLYQVTPRGNE
jgi:hypothetical protein